MNKGVVIAATGVVLLALVAVWRSGPSHCNPVHASALGGTFDGMRMHALLASKNFTSAQIALVLESMRSLQLISEREAELKGGSSSANANPEQCPVCEECDECEECSACPDCPAPPPCPQCPQCPACLQFPEFEAEAARTREQLREAQVQLQAQCPKKPDYPTKLLYISDEVTGGSGNQFSFLTEALRLAKRMNRTLDLGNVWNRAPAGVFKQLDMAQLQNGNVFMADDAAFQALTRAWQSLGRPVRGVQIAEGYLGQHPRIPVNIEWTSADVNRYPDMVPPNAMSYGDMMSQFMSYDTYDVISVGGRTVLWLGMHAEQMRWAHKPRNCTQPYGLMEEQYRQLTRDIMLHLPIKPDVLKRARDWSQATFGLPGPPAALALRTKDVMWENGVKKCPHSWYWSYCPRVCVQTGDYATELVATADSMIPAKERAPEGKPQVYISLMLAEKVVATEHNDQAFSREEYDLMTRNQTLGIKFICPQAMSDVDCVMMDWALCVLSGTFWSNFQSSFSTTVLALRDGTLGEENERRMQIYS